MKSLAIRHRYAVALAVILLAGIVLRVWGLTWGLYDATVSRRPHPDEWTVYWLFTWFGQHHSLDPCPKAGTQCFFDWGMSFPYLAYGIHALLQPVFAALPQRSFGQGADPVFVQDVIAGRITSSLVSAATILVAYKLAASMYGRDAGLVAAALASLSALLIQLAHFATPDSTTILLLSLALLAIYQTMCRPSAQRFLIAGVLIGMSAGSEYHMGLLFVPLIAALFLGGCRDVRLLLVAAGAALAAYFVSNPYILVHPSAFIAAIHHTLLIRTVDSQAQYGDQWAAYGPSPLYVVHYALGYGVGVAFTIWMIAATLGALLRRARTEILLLSWVIPYFLLATFSAAKFMRYSAPLLPALAVLGGGFAVSILRRRHARRFALALAAVAIVFTALYDAAYAGLFTARDPRIQAADWLQQQAPLGATVAFEQLPNGLINLPYFFSQPRYPACFALFRPSLLTGPQRFLILDRYDLEEHPRIPTSSVQRFRAALLRDPSYFQVAHLHNTPSILGLDFPIDNSPHDWRYPDHTVSIYENSKPEASGAANCFANVDSAVAALYVPTGGQ